MSSASLSDMAPVWTFQPGEPLKRVFPGNCVPHTAAELWLRAGQVPLDRILMEPAPGTATRDDAVYSKERFKLSCELVNGILVAKAMSYFESKVAIVLAYFLHRYLDDHPIGEVAGADGGCETVDENIRKPDVSFTSFARIEERGAATHKNLPFSPDLAVEILSPSNTTAEMDKKLREYFSSGARLVWYIEPELRTARVFTAVEKWADLRPTDSLRGSDVLPGFELPLTKLFEKAGPRMSE